ncbi:MAG: DUF3597 domain-containing protein [Sphingopyxis sp.]
MGIFSSIKNAIFGQSNDAASAGAAMGASVAAAAPVAVAAAPVDVEAVLNAKLAAKGVDLNWQTSIVDLMKLLDMDSSLTSRKELAAELGYTGPLDGSADMNIRLHRAVMKALSVNGGVVPAAMMD